MPNDIVPAAATGLPKDINLPLKQFRQFASDVNAVVDLLGGAEELCTHGELRHYEQARSVAAIIFCACTLAGLPAEEEA
ncbi:hypothetical protein [Methylocella sp.]|uniref:hypothetical protein n=1 Tax=Methylocella sp. TaxID=1978226 RepID=UPI0037841C75